MNFGSFFGSSGNKFKDFNRAIELIIGSKPKNPLIYQLAFRHTSASKESSIKGFRESNERLEFLGDAVLGLIVGEYLFKKYPFKDEGFLTEIRSRIVNRESLNNVGRKLGLETLIESDGNKNFHRTSLLGDAMEALIGAIYLDKGFKFTQKFVVSILIPNHFNLEEVISNNTNYKSSILTWAQAEGKKVEFLIVEEKGKNHSREFVAQVLVDTEIISHGNGWNKKKAEQDASRRACEILKI